MDYKMIRVRITLREEALGMMPADENLHDEYIASKAPDAKTMEEEIEEFGVEGVQAKGRTVFPRLPDGTPFLYDYQIKGFFKDAMGMLRKAPKSASGKYKAYKKAIDGLLFIKERRIPFDLHGLRMGDCQRPLRAMTPMGERVALASSETVPEGSTLEFTILLLEPELEAAVRECLDYGQLRGLGQWRNSGKGAFDWEEI